MLRKLMTLRFSAISTLFLLIKVIKSLSKVFMQQYNYPKLIWMKQMFLLHAVIADFYLHLSEPNRIKTREKRIVNWIVTTELWCTIISVNRFTFIIFKVSERLTSPFCLFSWATVSHEPYRKTWTLPQKQILCGPYHHKYQILLEANNKIMYTNKIAFYIKIYCFFCARYLHHKP